MSVMRVTANCRMHPATRNGLVHIGVAAAASDAQLRAVCASDQRQYGPFRLVDPDHGSWPLTPQQRVILDEILARITPDWTSQVLVPFLRGENRMPSLRCLDWFVTNYSKSRGIVIDGIDVHCNYTVMREAYQCRNFDPFRRNLKMSIRVDAQTLFTTVSQVNFLCWADEHGYIDYVRQHQSAIDEDMQRVHRLTLADKRAAAQKGIKRKRQPLSQTGARDCVFIVPHSG